MLQGAAAALAPDAVNHAAAGNVVDLHFGRLKDRQEVLPERKRAADIDDADELAVFVAEEREGSFGFLVEFSLVGFDLGVVDDLGVDELLDLEELRVSMFAQELGAKSGISPKKLAQRLQALRG